MPLILAAASPEVLLSLFEKEKDRYGWVTAAETIKRLAKRAAKARGGRSRAAIDKTDERLEALMSIPVLALSQNVMDSKARRGHNTDDLTSLREAVETLGLREHASGLHPALEAKLAEEAEEAEESEPGEFGDDFQGGSIGF